MAKKQPGVALPGQLEGPDTHVSNDQTVGDVPVIEAQDGSYPKYKFHSSGQNIVVDNAEDEANLGEEWQDSPAAFEEQGEPAEEVAPVTTEGQAE